MTLALSCWLVLPTNNSAKSRAEGESVTRDHTRVCQCDGWRPRQGRTYRACQSKAKISLVPVSRSSKGESSGARPDQAPNILLAGRTFFRSETFSTFPSLIRTRAKAGSLAKALLKYMYLPFRDQLGKSGLLTVRCDHFFVMKS